MRLHLSLADDARAASRLDLVNLARSIRLTRSASLVAQRDRLRGIYVLLVSDDPDTLDIFGSYIRHYGAHVRGAVNGHDAPAYLAIARPNVIVTDQMMPGIGHGAVAASSEDGG